MTRRVTRSWKEYSRWLPLPVASRTDGVDEVGPGPVVQLAVGDADDLADLGDAVALLVHRTLLGGDGEGWDHHACDP